MGGSCGSGDARQWIERAVENLPAMLGGAGDSANFSFYINAFEGERRRVRRVLVKGQASDDDIGAADAVVILSRECRVQTFPPDLSVEPIRLRSPVKSVAFRVAMEHVANRLGRRGRGAAHPGFA